MHDHAFSKLANHQVRHQTTHIVGCRPGDCIWSLYSSSGVCVGMYGLTYLFYSCKEHEGRREKEADTERARIPPWLKQIITPILPSVLINQVCSSLTLMNVELWSCKTDSKASESLTVL